MIWEDFKKGEEEHSPVEWRLTNVECPKCGKEIYRYTMVTYVTYPPKRRYKCFGCGWEDLA